MSLNIKIERPNFRTPAPAPPAAQPSITPAKTTVVEMRKEEAKKDKLIFRTHSGNEKKFPVAEGKKEPPKVEVSKFTIEKPKTSPIKISLAEQITLEMALKWMSTFTQKVDNERLMAMNDQFRRIKLADSRRQRTRPVDKNEEQKQKAEIQTYINKLNLDKYQKILDDFIGKENFLKDSYLEDIADILHERTLTESHYTNLYSFFVCSLHQILNDESTKTLHDKFLARILANSTRELEKLPIETDKIMNHATFFGCMVMREIFPIEILYKHALRFIKMNEAAAFDVCISLVAPVGQKLEEKFPDAANTIYAPLSHLTNNKSFPSRLRFRALDIVDVRTAHWEGLDKLIPQIYTIENAKKLQANALSMVSQKKVEEKPKIIVAVNKFSILSMEDEEEEEFEPFNPEDMIEKFVVDQEITSNWVEGDVLPLFGNIIILTKRRALNVLPIITELHSQNNFNTQLAFNACQELFKLVVSPEYSTTDSAAILGRIYARISTLDTSFIDRFSEVFITYNLSSIYDFLLEIIRMKKGDLITESDYWRSYGWRPVNVSHLDIVETFENDAVLEMFPLYNSLFTLYAHIFNIYEEEEDIEEISPESILEIIKDVQSDILEMPEFGICVIEMIIKKDAPSIGCIAKEFLSQQKVIIPALENIFLINNLPADLVASYFLILFDCSYPVKEYFLAPMHSDDTKVCEFHQAIAAELK